MSVRLTEQQKANGMKRAGEIWDMTLPNPDLIVDRTQNLRYKGHTLAELEELAWSIINNGQDNAVTIRKDGEKYRLVAGFGREGAVELINLHPEKFNLEAGTKWPLKVQFVVKNEEESMAANLEENLRRKDLSPMDYAFIGRQMIDRFGKTAEEVAAYFKRSVGWLYQIMSLLKLPDALRDLVHDDTIGTALAIKLATLDEKTVKEVWERADGDIDKLTAAVGTARKKAGKASSRSMPDLNKLLRVTDCYASGVLKSWITGEMDDADFRAELESWKKKTK